MNYKGYEPQSGKNATDQTTSPAFDLVDSFFSRLDQLRKTKLEADKARDDVNSKVADLDLHAQYYGVGTVHRDPKTGQIMLTPPKQAAVPPIAYGQIGYGMAAAGATPQAIAQTMQSLNPPAAGIDPNRVPGSPPAAAGDPASLPPGAAIDAPMDPGGGPPQFVNPAAQAATPAQAPNAPASAPTGTAPSAGAPGYSAAIMQQVQDIMNSPQMQALTPVARVAAQKALMASAAKAQLSPAAKEASETDKLQLTADVDFNTVGNTIGNAVAGLKSAFAVQGGPGPVAGTYGNARNALGDESVGAIPAYEETRRATALSLARQFSGGSRGAVTLFQNLLQNFPSNRSTSTAAGSTFAEMYLTAFALKKATADLSARGVDVSKLDAATLAQTKIASWSPEETDRLYEAIGKKFAAITPRKMVDLNGNVTTPGSSSGPEDENTKKLRAQFGPNAKIKRVA